MSNDASIKKTKVIQINPDLLRVVNNKTKKQKLKTSSQQPIINPNALKKKLLNRIKEHKKNEIKIAENIAKNTAASIANIANPLAVGSFTASRFMSPSANISSTDNDDEFQNAISYLAELSKKKMQKNKTLKSPPTITSATAATYPAISLDLPQELLENSPLTQQQTPPTNMELNYAADNIIPYGCLKGGTKPTYRTWTRKNMSSTSGLNRVSLFDKLDQERPPTPPKSLSTKTIASTDTGSVNIEEKMLQMREKLKQIKEQDMYNNSDGGNAYKLPDILTNTSTNSGGGTNKKYLKRTIRRKFQLGKMGNQRRVGVLVKDKKTRKRILNAQKELKKTNMADVRKYLKEHGLIKVGATAPNDVLRKMFEDAVLAGDINNKNKDILIHNFLNDTTTESDK